MPKTNLAHICAAIAGTSVQLRSVLVEVHLTSEHLWFVTEKRKELLGCEDVHVLAELISCKATSEVFNAVDINGGVLDFGGLPVYPVRPDGAAGNFLACRAIPLRSESFLATEIVRAFIDSHRLVVDALTSIQGRRMRGLPAPPIPPEVVVARHIGIKWPEVAGVTT